MNTAGDKSEILPQFELDETNVGLEEIDIVASVLAELLRDTEAALKEGTE